MPVACIFVPDFPAEAVLRTAPELRAEAVVVVDGKPPLLNVIALNERARQSGVYMGMTKLQAESRFPGVNRAGERLALRHRSLAQEAAAHAALLDAACGFSPRVEATAAAPDTVWLDLAGLERLFGPPATLARELSQRVSHMGLEANVAVAANAETAELAARGFPSITVIAPGTEAERLGSLAVELLPCGNDALETLNRWGIRHLRGLAALPETAVHQRLGEHGVRLQKLARGLGSRPLVPSDPPLNFVEEVELEYPVDLLEPLAFMLNRMLEQLCARLCSRALSTNELRLSMTLTGGQAHQLCLRLPVPMLDAKVFLRLLQLELRAQPPMGPVEKLSLSAEPTPPRFTQGGLFLPAAPEPEKLELVLARIKSIVGEPAARNRRAERHTAEPSEANAEAPPAKDATRDGAETGESQPVVGSAEILDTHRPDAFRIKPFTALVATHAEKSGVKPTTPTNGDGLTGPHATPLQHAPSPALRRFRPPIAVNVELHREQPMRILGDSPTSAGERKAATGQCLSVAGPWHESGDWWSDAPWSREVWDIALTQAEGSVLYRLYRDLRSEQWFLEGMYD